MARGLFLLSVLCLIPMLTLFAQEEQERWDLMTVKEIGVDRFLAEHPDAFYLLVGPRDPTARE